MQINTKLNYMHNSFLNLKVAALPASFACLLAAVSFSFGSCTKDGSLETADSQINKKITFCVSAPDDSNSGSDTKVKYVDNSLKLTWQSGDKLAALGYNSSDVYQGVSTDYTYGGTDGATSGTFSGTEVASATKYNVYYPSTVNVTAAGAVSLSMEGQTQAYSGNTKHLKNYMLLEAKGVEPDPEGNFPMTMKSSIMKFVISNVPEDVGELQSLTMTVETSSGTKTQIMYFTNVDFSVYSGDFQAFMSFLPSEISGPKAGGKFKVMLSGAKSYIYTMTSTAGVQYKEGKRYTAAIDMSETAKVSSGAYMAYTIKTTSANQYVPLGLSTSSQTAPAKLTIDWGDGSSSTIESGTAIGASGNNTHKYVTIGTYTVSITSGQSDPTLQQISMIDFYYSADLVSVDTPFLNSTQTSFEDCFRNCSSLTTVPAGLFDYSTDATDFGGTFRGSGITTLPSGLFDKNTAATKFDYCFYCCTSLTTAPSGLFDKNTAVTNFRACFYQCTSLVMNKYIFSSTDATATRFSGKTVIFQACFFQAGYSLTAGTQGQAPELWKYTMTSSTKTDCFTDAYFTNKSTSAPDNYDTAWGTPK